VGGTRRQRMAVVVGGDKYEGLEPHRATFGHGGEDDVGGARDEQLP
jgi:hypothetical protein